MSVLGQLRDNIFGPRSVQIAQMTNPCPACDAPGVVAEMYLDSDGQPDMMVIKCQKCGPVKNLYPGHRRPQPRFEKNFWEATHGEFNKKRLVSKKEI